MGFSDARVPYSSLDKARKRSAVQSARHEALLQALKGFDDDFLTSDTHHPGYVLIPTEVFERIRTALASDREVGS
jgi:hypothetical protein